jgi:hypothetical protein
MYAMIAIVSKSSGISVEATSSRAPAMPDDYSVMMLADEKKTDAAASVFYNNISTPVARSNSSLQLAAACHEAEQRQARQQHAVGFRFRYRRDGQDAAVAAASWRGHIAINLQEIITSS